MSESRHPDPDAQARADAEQRAKAAAVAQGRAVPDDTKQADDTEQADDAGQAEGAPNGATRPRRRRPPEIPLGRRRVPLPANRIARISLGVLLVIAGLVGFLPILGFWMVPLGIIVLSYDIPAAARLRRRVARWWRNRRRNQPKG